MDRYKYREFEIRLNPTPPTGSIIKQEKNTYMPDYPANKNFQKLTTMIIIRYPHRNVQILSCMITIRD